MESGSSGRENKAYGFTSDDILCSYEDYGTQDANDGAHSVAPTHDHQDFRVGNKPRTTFHSVMSTVENNMKKQTDNIMRFLEGISSRLSQLELHCYNLDKSIGEMRSDIVRGHEESDSKLKSLDKHVQEVHRSVQILRDKQELADTQKELAKLQLAEKEPVSSNTSQNEDRASNPAMEPKQSETSSYVHDQQLALVPHQQAPPPQPVEHQQPHMPPPSSLPQQGMPPTPAYYLLPSQTTNMTAPSQPSQTQYLPIMSQVQDPSRGNPPPQQSQVNQAPHGQSPPSYQHQWLQNQPPQQTVMQQQIRNPSQIVYSNYQLNPPPAEMTSNSMPMQVPYPGSSQAGGPGSESMPYGFAPTGRPIQQQPPTQHSKTGYSTPPGDGYVPSGPRPGNAYVMFEGEGGRAQPHFQQSPYPPPTSFALQNVQRPPSPHPYNELIEKLASMGYRGENVVGVIRRLEESGQPIDFNSVLDRLNAHAAGGPPRGWSG
ncbi:hypothetical protein ACS0TY_017448 [Phlomoides rotata]